jgi:esterase/lipase
MNEIFIISAGILTVLHFTGIGATLLPLCKIRRSLNLAGKRLRRIKTEGKSFDLSSKDRESLFLEKRLSATWKRYLSCCSFIDQKTYYPDPEDFFNSASYFERHTNTKLSALLPMFLMLFSGIFAAGYAYWNIQSHSTGRIPLAEIFLLLSGSALLNLLFAIFYQVVLFSVRRAMSEFVSLLEDHTGGKKCLSVQLSEISQQLAFFREEQNEFYEVQSAQLGALIIGSLEPFLESQQKLTENFVNAATTDQEQAMQNLAQYFAEQMTKLYAKQMAELTEITADMAEIQAKTSLSLSNISEFFELSRDSMEHIHLDSKALSAAFNEQIHQLDVLNQSMDTNVKTLADLSDYIRTNSRNQKFTIENLSDFQDRLLATSDRSTEAMETFFTEFKDHYSSYLVAMKAASADMKGSADLIQNAYKEFAAHMDHRVSQTFMQFEEQMSRLALRLAESAQDLGEAVDELPDIIRRIKPTDDS